MLEKRGDGFPMTKEQFEEGRRQAVSRYMETAHRDRSAPGATKRQKENAGHRIQLCTGLLSKWAQDGFWTATNIRAYEMIYKHYDGDMPVSAL